MPRATFDTNIYVSALVFGGTPRRLLALAIDGEIEVAISEAIVDETTRVLRDKFGWPRERLDAAKELIGGFARLVVPSTAVDGRIRRTTAFSNAPWRLGRNTS